MVSRRGRSVPRRGVAWLLGAVLVLAGCSGVVFDAPEVTILVKDDRIVYAAAGAEERLVGGETVVRIENDSNRRHQVVLARLGDATTIPPDLRQAESPREDGRILGMSHELEPRESTFESGGFGYETDGTSFHVHLRAGERYVVFDRMAPEQVRAVEFVPGDEST